MRQQLRIRTLHFKTVVIMAVKTYPTLLRRPAYCTEIRSQTPKGEIYYTGSLNTFYLHLMGESGIRCKAELARTLGGEN